MALSSGEERRQHPRLYASFPILVRGVDACGEAFESPTVLDNFSAGGLHVRLTRRVEPGAWLFAVVRLLPASHPVSGPRVAVRGRVVRVEPQREGQWGMGVQFTRHRFL